MFASEAIPLNHSRSGDPEYCCSAWKHNFHFRPGAPMTPGHLIWCCCKSLTSVIEDPSPAAKDADAGPPDDNNPRTGIAWNE